MIRPATRDDWPRIGELGDVLIRRHHEFDRSRFIAPNALPRDAYVARVREELASGRAMINVADANGVVVGYVFAGVEPESWKELRPDAGYIHDLVVDPAHRRSGIARALVASAIDWFTARGTRRVMLWTAQANIEAQQLFDSLGFRRTMIEMTRDD